MRYLFGDYVLDTQRYELHDAGAPIKLRRKAFQVLVYLLAHRDRVVPKQEILAHLWPDQFVGDEVLKACITALRKALGEKGRASRFVRTLHGQGYRFVAPVEAREHLPADDTPPTLHRHAGEGTTHHSEEHEPALAPRLADLWSTPWEAQDGEHKHITVLCGALADVPALTVHLGPEGLYRLLQAWLALVQEVVHRYEGTLTSSTEEGFTALFGAPTAQEDHARRAVLVALDLRECCQTHMILPAPVRGIAVTMQLGLHSGLVVAGNLGAPPQRRYMAVGEATQMALRVQQHAVPGMICLSAATYALVQAEIESAPVDAVEVAGLPAPVPVYTVQRLRQRRAGVTGHGARVRSRFVGRAREVALLQTSLAQVAQGQGHVIGIVGDPGMGKSRLLAEFRRSLAGQTVTYYTGQCLPDGQMTPYLPVQDVVRQHCGLRATDPPEAVMASVRRCVQEAGLGPEEAAPALLQLLDIPVQDAAFTQLSPEERKALTFRVLHQLSRSASQRQPLVLAVEDVHWIDATSEAWLATLVEWLASAPMLVLVTYRPGISAILARAVECNPDGTAALDPARQSAAGAVRAADGDCS
jgi:DNA-binding winged helix-turn-helix (wHTH) protein/ABC-type hemin transport system ATPase subunit